MDIEHAYLAALELTRQMLNATTAQNWDVLTQLEAQRRALLASTPPLASLSLTPTQAGRLADIITAMKGDNDEILEYAQVCQEHTRILLRLDNPAPQ